MAELVQQNAAGVAWAACFHAQQAAEKALKAVLVFQGIDFPRSHALDRLAALLPVHIRSRFDEEALATLTAWAIAGRYPEDIENPDARHTAEVVTMAHDVVLAARTLLS